MITVTASIAIVEENRPILCPKCRTGKIGITSVSSKIRRDIIGKSLLLDYLATKCPKCRSWWQFTIE